MAEYRFTPERELTKEEMDEVSKSIVSRQHENRITLGSEGVKIITPIKEAVRLIVREELEAFKADIMKQVMSDISTQIGLQRQANHER